MTDSAPLPLIDGLIDDALSVLHHDGAHEGPIFEYERSVLRKRFAARLGKHTVPAPSRLHERENLIAIIRPMIEPVCSDGNSNSAQLARDIADAILASLREPGEGAPIPAYVIEALNYIADNSGERDMRAAARDVLDLDDKGREP